MANKAKVKICHLYLKMKAMVKNPMLISTRLEVVPYRFFQTIKSPSKDMRGMPFRHFHSTKILLKILRAQSCSSYGGKAVVKNPPASGGDARDVGSIPG